MINVLHLRDTDRVCGPGKTIIETARAATAGEFHHVVGLPLLESEGRNEYFEAAVERGVDVVPLRSAHQLDPRILRAILRVVRDREIHLVHSHEYKTDLLAWAVSRLHPIPIMTTVHGWIRNDLKGRLYVRAGQAVLSRFDRVVAVSDRTRQAVLACGVPAERVVLIHNGIVAERYDPAGVEPGQIRRRFGIPADARVVGCIGRLSPEKGQRDLLAAAGRVFQTHQDVRLLFCGDGPDRPVLEREAARTGVADRVIFTGHLSDVRPVYRDIDLLALTSHTEGLPNVILEALCMETPVLATDVGGVREVVEDGRTGLLLPAGAIDAIADRLARLLDSPQWAGELARNGKATVLERFSFGQRVAKEEAVCRDMLAAWRTRRAPAARRSAAGTPLR